MSFLIERRRARAAALACVVLFFMLGFGVASWFSRVPDVRDALGLSPREVGLVLLLGSLGSLIALPSSGPLVGAIGARRVARIGVTLWSLALCGISAGVAAHSRVAVVVCLLVFSCGLSLWGSTMNIEGGFAQAALGKVILDKLHAMFSIGTVMGALAGSAVLALHLPVWVHLGAIALVAWIAVMTATHHFFTDSEMDSLSPNVSASEARARTKRAWGERQTVLIALMVLSAGLMEGAANDWLPLAMVDGYGVHASIGSLVFSFFLVVMSAVRLGSGRLRARTSPTRLLRTLLFGACVGLALVAFSPSIWLAIPGVVLWAAGSALVFPTGGSALSREPAMTAARMSVLSTINYGSNLVGPPLLGLIADHVGYHRALACLILPVLVGALLARALPPSVTAGPSDDDAARVGA